MNKLKPVAGVLVLFVVALAVASGLIFRAERAEYEQLQALVRLGERKALL